MRLQIQNDIYFVCLKNIKLKSIKVKDHLLKRISKCDQNSKKVILKINCILINLKLYLE